MRTVLISKTKFEFTIFRYDIVIDEQKIITNISIFISIRIKVDIFNNTKSR